MSSKDCPPKIDFDPVDELSPRLARIDILFFAADDLREVGLGIEAQRRCRSIVEICGFGAKLRLGVIDE